MRWYFIIISLLIFIGDMVIYKYDGAAPIIIIVAIIGVLNLIMGLFFNIMTEIYNEADNLDL